LRASAQWRKQNMKLQFPQTLEAAMGAEKSRWKIGDALVREAEETTTGPRGLRAVKEELAANGIEYETHTLSDMRSTADAFPRNRRHELPFEVHRDAGNPDTLDVIVKAAKKGGQKVTKWYVRDALQSMRDQQRAAREEAKAEARREQEKAEAEEEAARKREKESQNRDERERAKRDRQRAAERKREAAENYKKAKIAPKRKDRPAPAEDDVPLLVLSTALMANANKAIVLANDSGKMLGRNISELSPKAIAGLHTAAMEAAEAWREFASKLKKVSSRPHLSVVNE
jgi:hypothetical protein